MPTAEFLQLLVVAVVAGYVGYLLGRASSKPAERTPTSSPLPGPDLDRTTAQQRSSPPPPAGTGGTAGGTERTAPRRSSAPPPAAAGLLKRDD